MSELRHIKEKSPVMGMGGVGLNSELRGLGGTLPPEPWSKRCPPSVPDHELIRLIGAGSYGEVWLACSILGEFRAAKLVYRSRFSDPRPFEREFEGIRHFEPVSRSHPSQLAILHVGKNEAAGFFYYLMELADDAGAGGGMAQDSESYKPHTLRLDLEQRGRLPVDECACIGLSLATALAHLHPNGLVHRDIKPSNVVFVKGVPKLGDIGLVTAAGETTSVVGTEGYIAPEGPGTAQADIYSLGKVLYEISTGLDRRRFAELPEDLREWPDRREVMEFNEIVLKACAKDPERRYASAEEMRYELEWLQGGKSVRRKRASDKRWQAGKRTAMAVAILVLVGSGGRFLLREPRQVAVSQDPVAARLYQQAKYRLHKLTPAAFQPAVANLKEAITRDPRFVQAYFALFEAYKDAIAVWVDEEWQTEYQTYIREIARTLHELSPNSPESHVVQSYVEWMGWHFERAIEEANSALRIDPGFARAHQLKAYYLLFSHGDAIAARREYAKASALDPTDSTTQLELGHPDFFLRDFKNALAKYREAAGLEPDSAMAHLWVGIALQATGEYAEALDEFEKWALLSSGGSPKIKAEMQETKERARIDGARGWLENDLERRRRQRPEDHFWIATDCAKLGRVDEALNLLKEAYDEHDPRMTDLLFDEQWDRCRDDSRFRQLVAKVGLKQTSVHGP